jgi:hypothetical protein
MDNKTELRKMQAMARARVARDMDAFDFLDEQDCLTMAEELLKFRIESKNWDDGVAEIDLDSAPIAKLFDRVA